MQVSISLRAAAARTAASVVATTLLAVHAAGQGQPEDGMREVDLRSHVITHATVVPAPGQRLENQTIVIRDGMIIAIGSAAAVSLPPGAREWDATGLTIYPGLIDAAVLVDPGETATSPHAHWNPQIRPEIDAVDHAVPGDSVAGELRALGFTAAAVYPSDGIFRGTGVVLSLANADQSPTVYRDRAAMATGFDRGGGYPGSLMGSIALMRQTLYDARWYQQAREVWQNYPQGNEPPARSDALEALNDVIDGHQQLLFEAGDEHMVLRAAKVANEFGLETVILGSGTEFRRIDDIAATGLPLILPVAYPEQPDVSTLAAAEATTLRDLMTWEQASTNARRLAERDVDFALTTHALDRRSSFHSNLRLAIHNGLSADDALAAITTTPAKMLGIDHLVGTIEAGKIANLVVVEGELFGKDAEVRDVWVDGRRYEINAAEDVGYTGAGELSITRTNAAPITARIEIDTEKNTVNVSPEGGETIKASQVNFEGDVLSFLLDGRPLGVNGYMQFSGALAGGEFTGTGALPDRSRFTFVITPTNEEVHIDEPASDEADADDGETEPAAERRGRRPQATEQDSDPVSGLWNATLNSDQFGEVPFSMTLSMDDDNSVTGSFESDFFTASLEDGTFDAANGELRMTVNGQGMVSTLVATVSGNQLSGTLSADAFRADIAATRAGGTGEGNARGRRTRGELDETDLAPETLNFPLGAYGQPAMPERRNVVLTNATIWTCGPQGIVENGWMVVLDGKVARIGSGEFQHGGPEQLEVIDCQGKHITPGLIDCHSHTGIDGGVNEGSQAVTAEVRIGDVIDPDDINWYRQLAGGLTACNQLHGSANPIGGQNSVVKLKWGGTAEDFRVNDAIKGIKFALGENVKRSQGRYPNTRMGVETLIRDSFRRADDYRNEWARYEALSAEEKLKTVPPRRDLELDALVEILEGERIIHCHSYRQDEILALIRTADEFGFTIGTLQHILEGYKVAEAIAEHGAGASSFSDWWAYKMEVMDAIPHNGAIMHDVGILVSFNSDSSELARRMNTEAAKAVRYGGVDPHEALKFVTLNPAKQLRIDDRTGSLEAGKDADFVIWSADPLSTYSRCEQTWIEGARYFSLEEDQQMREQVAAERERLIQKILAKEHGSLDEAAEEEADASPQR